jgi:hypothetical protein
MEKPYHRVDARESDGDLLLQPFRDLASILSNRSENPTAGDSGQIGDVLLSAPPPWRAVVTGSPFCIVFFNGAEKENAARGYFSRDEAARSL